MSYMSHTRESLLADRRESIEREIASLERKITKLRKKIDNPKDPIRSVFYSYEYPYGTSWETPLEVLPGVHLKNAIKAGIALANEKRRSLWISHQRVFSVYPGENVRYVAQRVEWIRKILFPTQEEYSALR